MKAASTKHDMTCEMDWKKSKSEDKKEKGAVGTPNNRGSEKAFEINFEFG